MIGNEIDRNNGCDGQKEADMKVKIEKIIKCSKMLSFPS